MPLYCIYCHKDFKDRGSLMEHLLINHEKENIRRTNKES